MRKLTMQELRRLAPSEFIQKNKIPLSLAADSIRSGHNVGSLFRLADCFALESILLGGYTAIPPHPEIEKTALGATKTVSWDKSIDLAKSLGSIKSERDALIIGLEQTDLSVSLQSYTPDWSRPIILVLGNEVTGIQNTVLEQLDVCIEIPQFGTKHSLNVSVAAGVAVWHFVHAWLQGQKA
ncbi:MAG: TrmH family RNA methyltransferase [Saprospiraceae bacterium]|jgi:tRNA G18 (ribose-2'-O)-methylase SpoU|nr:TrmH family RNA methyltransferase [Saprospiraceae bacterium]MBK7794957.1 TrmH family RNA methyltransferase [Saprospiraceae bacterium]MBK8153420.1 TrmH family RNA methyltransferase [Saprospiraceae bacterium]MBL0262153.1 TrmH family RNA methyltransferase [Saprospiraceae bacterium]